MSEIRGLQSLITKLNALNDLVIDGAKIGIEKSVINIRDDAKSLCPVDTGALRDSIVSEVNQVAYNKIEGTITAEKEYAVDVEFGTGQKGSQSIPHDNDIVGRAPKPFMFPAYIANKDETMNNIRSDIKNSIREVAKK